MVDKQIRELYQNMYTIRYICAKFCKLIEKEFSFDANINIRVFYSFFLRCLNWKYAIMSEDQFSVITYISKFDYYHFVSSLLHMLPQLSYLLFLLCICVSSAYYGHRNFVSFLRNWSLWKILSFQTNHYKACKIILIILSGVKLSISMFY